MQPLPNAIAGQPYAATVALPDGAVPLAVEGLPAIGLTFDPASARIEGRPHRPGDYPLRVHFRAAGSSPGNAPVQVAELLFIVNADPRSLWIAQPSDSLALFAKADSQHALVQHAGLRAVLASQRGRAHAQAGDFREDHAHVQALPHGEWLLALVADGAGSATYAREGSRLACATIAEGLAAVSADRWQGLESLAAQWLAMPSSALTPAISHALHELLLPVLKTAQAAIAATAQQHQKAAKDFATTLALQLVCRLPGGGFFVGSWGVGDSPAILLNAADTPDLLHTPEEGEFGGETHFLTEAALFQSPEASRQRINWRVVPRFKALILMSDGVYDPYFETHYGLMSGARWTALWSELSAFLHTPDADTQLLHWLDFWSVGNHDDRTILIVMPDGG